MQTVLGAAEVSLAPPSASRSGRGIGLYLLELGQTPPDRTARRPPLQLCLRYLVTTWADEPEEAHRLLGELVFAAVESEEFETDLDPLPAAAWAALGAPPQPSFVLRVPLRLERPQPPSKLVRRPLVIHAVARSSIHGLVVGPGDVPVAGARVELPALRLSERTDTKGRFCFPTVPAEPGAKALRVKAKGRELSVTAELPTPDGEPLVIHFDPREG